MTGPSWPQPRVPAVLDRAAASVFSQLARRRGARPFHPRGMSYRGVVRPVDLGTAVPFVASPETPVVVRLSAALGLPRPLFDIMGLGVRVQDAYGPGRHQDLLLASSSEAPVLRHMLVPTRGLARRFYSSLLAYRHDGRLRLVGARWAAPPTLQPLHPDDLRHAGFAAPIVFELAIADLTGPWLTVGRLELEEPLSDRTSAALRFDPWNAAPGFRPVGPLNHLRAAAYRASRRVTTSP